MSVAFGGLLAGIGSGIGSVYTKEGEAKRDNQRKENSLLADSIAHRLENDETLTDDDALNLHGQELKLRGVPDKDIQDILQHSKYHARMHADSMKKASAVQGPGLDSPEVAAQTVKAPVVNVPGQAKPDQGADQVIPGVAAGQGAGPSLPPLPEYTPKTQGDYKIEQEGRKLEVTNKAALALKSAEDRAAIQAKIDAFEQTTGNKMTPQQVAALIGAGGKGVRSQGKQIIGSAITFQPGEPEVDIHNNPIDPKGVYTQLVDTYGNAMGYVPGSATAKGQEWIKMDPSESSTGYGHVYYDSYGRATKVEANVMPPAAYLPRISSSAVQHAVPQADGSITIETFNNSTTSTRGIPGGNVAASQVVAPGQTASPAQPAAQPAVPTGAGPASPLPSPQSLGVVPAKPPAMPVGVPGQGVARGNGRVIGHKSLSPEDQAKNTQNMGQVSNTIDIVHQVQSRIPLLAGLIDAGKITLQTHDGLLQAIVNRNVPMTPEEDKLAGDMKTLTEDINLLRGPLGATGFRGAEAFAALQAQAGSLMQRPEVTMRTLSNTLRALETQQEFWKKNPQYGVQVTPSTPIPDNPGGTLPKGQGKTIDKTTAIQFYNAAGKDPKKAQALAEQNGWVVPK